MTLILRASARGATGPRDPDDGARSRHDGRMEERFALATPAGEVSAAWQGADGPALVVAHGAGAGMDHPFMSGFADALAAAGVSALRFNFPYIEKGRRSPGSPKDAIAAYTAAVEEATTRSAGRP